MILAIKTDSMTAQLALYGLDGKAAAMTEWEAGRALSRDLLAQLESLFARAGSGWRELTGIVVFRGPGSFTSLRIGITVMNTTAYALSVPIVGETGDDWLASGIARLKAGDDDRMVLPLYGAEPHITPQKK